MGDDPSERTDSDAGRGGDGGTCAFTYDRDGDTTVSCPRAAHAERGRCVFHLAPDDRAAVGVDGDALQAAFGRELAADDQRRRRFYGCRFYDLDLGSLVLDADDVESVVFAGVRIEGLLDLSNATVRNPLVLHDCAVGELRARAATFERDVYVEDVTVGVVDAAGAVAAASRATFERNLHVDRTAFRGPVDLTDATVGERCRVDHVSVDGDFRLDDLTADEITVESLDAAGVVSMEGVDLESARIEAVSAGRLTLREAAVTDELHACPDRGCRVDCHGATIRGGRLAQPEGVETPHGTALDALRSDPGGEGDHAADEGRATGAVPYDLTEATLGDVALDARAWEAYRFGRTDFDGFEFTAYYERLRRHDWRLPGAAAGEGPDAAEVTYLKAKNGARAVGHGDAAAEFFIREMRHRRRRYAGTVRDGSYPPGERATAAGRAATNLFLDAVAGYGERPQRVLGVAGLVVGLWTLLYRAGGVTSGLGESLYFSVVTFTTLGYGDVVPVTTATKLLAASEGVAGAFLTALFVFALGRRVAR